MILTTNGLKPEGMFDSPFTGDHVPSIKLACPLAKVLRC